MKPLLSFCVVLLVSALSVSLNASTIVNASTTTYIASTDPFGSAPDADSSSYFDPALVLTPQFFSATSNFDGGSAYAWGYAAVGVMGGLITASQPTAVISQNADAQARSTFSVSDTGIATDGTLSAGTAFTKTFNLGVSGTSSPQPPCCIDSLYALATFAVTDITTGSNQIVNLRYGVGVATGAQSATVTLHVGDELELDYGIDMANYVSALSPIPTLFADYSNTFDFYVNGGDPNGTVISSTGYDYSEISPGAAPEPATLDLALASFGVLYFARRRRAV